MGGGIKMANEAGKITKAYFEKYILPKTGAKRNEVIVPPKSGVDTGVIRIAPGRVMAVTTDPFAIHPSLGWHKAAWFAFHIIASDLCTSGLPPEYLSVDLNLPVSIKDGEISEMWDTVHEECRKYGVAVVTGHTARYDGTDYPMVGGATMMGTGSEDEYITSAMSRPGDAVIITKTVAIEAAAMLTAMFPQYVEKELGTGDFRKLDSMFYRMTTVDESMEASRFGLRSRGITSMHDATEGGVLGALYEIADASGNGILIEKDKLPLSPEVSRISELFGMNPYRSISEGTLLITAVPDKADAFVKRLNAKGIESVIAGYMKEENFGRKIEDSGMLKDIDPPGHDDYWKAINYGVSRRLK